MRHGTTGMKRPPSDPKQRRAAVRTAWIVGGIAIAVYLAFLLSGMLGR